MGRDEDFFPLILNVIQRLILFFVFLNQAGTVYVNFEIKRNYGF
jgi:hypothetical protein